VNWTDDRNGPDDNDVWLVYSDDQGNSWTEPIRVNDDPAGAQQFFTWMDVDDATGHIHIVFYDRRDAIKRFPDVRMKPSWNTEVYVASSYDGGDTWKNLKVSTKSFRPNPKQFFGDYNNISAYDGVVRPIWTRNDEGILSVWTAILDGYVE
jgi:Neuraminidase (sialidase)